MVGGGHLVVGGDSGGPQCTTGGPRGQFWWVTIVLWVTMGMFDSLVGHDGGEVVGWYLVDYLLHLWVLGWGQLDFFHYINQKTLGLVGTF